MLAAKNMTKEVSLLPVPDVSLCWVLQVYSFSLHHINPVKFCEAILFLSLSSTEIKHHFALPTGTERETCPFETDNVIHPVGLLHALSVVLT